MLVQSFGANADGDVVVVGELVHSFHLATQQRHITSQSPHNNRIPPRSYPLSSRDAACWCQTAQTWRKWLGAARSCRPCLEGRRVEAAVHAAGLLALNSLLNVTSLTLSASRFKRTCQFEELARLGSASDMVTHLEPLCIDRSRLSLYHTRDNQSPH